MKKVEKGHLSFGEGMTVGRSQRPGKDRQVDWEKVKRYIEEDKSDIQKSESRIS